MTIEEIIQQKLPQLSDDDLRELLDYDAQKMCDWLRNLAPAGIPEEMFQTNSRSFIKVINLELDRRHGHRKKI